MKSFISPLSAVVTFLLLCSALAMGQIGVTTYHNDIYRSAVRQTPGIACSSQPLDVPGVSINGTLHNVDWQTGDAES